MKTQNEASKKRGVVTILINGLPLVQIELKKIGTDYLKAFSQIKNYSKEAYLHNPLFRFIQLFIISNDLTTRYFANNDVEQMNEQHIFEWVDDKNQTIDNLEKFVAFFLKPCFLAEVIASFIVLDENDKKLIVMRPHQIHAVRALIEKAKNTNNHGYVWHSTGSGKTLTSFKLSQSLKYTVPEVQIFFLVDRKDLDHQTVTAFNRFEADSIDYTENTTKLRQQLKDKNANLILTTIQKMSSIAKKRDIMIYSKDFKTKKLFLLSTNVIVLFLAIC